MHPLLSLLLVSTISGAGAPAAAKPEIEPAAIEALSSMGSFLRSQKSMALSLKTETDEVLENGQKVRLSATIDLKARRPDRLRAEIVSDRKVRQFFYDGKTFTVFGPRIGYYATVEAPKTVRELIEVLRSRYGIDMPVADLFYWGTDRSGVESITAAIDVGPATVEGVACEQYAFRQPDLDWQIWIEKGPRALPRKLVLTNTGDPARPEHSVAFKWKLDPKLGDRLFEFVHPRGAYRIELETLKEPNVD